MQGSESRVFFVMMDHQSITWGQEGEWMRWNRCCDVTDWGVVRAATPQSTDVLHADTGLHTKDVDLNMEKFWLFAHFDWITDILYLTSVCAMNKPTISINKPRPFCWSLELFSLCLGNTPWNSYFELQFLSLPFSHGLSLHVCYLSFGWWESLLVWMCFKVVRSTQQRYPTAVPSCMDYEITISSHCTDEVLPWGAVMNGCTVTQLK